MAGAERGEENSRSLMSLFSAAYPGSERETRIIKLHGDFDDDDSIVHSLDKGTLENYGPRTHVEWPPLT